MGTYSDHKIIDGVLDGYFDDPTPAIIETTVSIGEFDGMVIGLHLPNQHGYDCVELTTSAVRALIAAMQDGLAVLEAHEVATVA